MWYFLRALWHEDGMTQRELSQIVGTMEPTTLTAINTMERRGFVKRVRNTEDRRRINVFLTERGHQLSSVLLPLAQEVTGNATTGFSTREKDTLLDLLCAMQRNLRVHVGDDPLED